MSLEHIEEKRKTITNMLNMYLYRVASIGEFTQFRFWNFTISSC